MTQRAHFLCKHSEMNILALYVACTLGKSKLWKILQRTRRPRPLDIPFPAALIIATAFHGAALRRCDRVKTVFVLDGCHTGSE